jgi:ABC-2 type transport system ATP-binding protein
MPKKPRKVIEAVNVSKAYKKKVVLHNASFALLKGEIHALLGPNGAGKSTLMKLIIGIEKPNNGQVLFFGERWHDKTKTGVVPQEEFFFPDFTVEKNLFLFGKMFNIFGRRLKERVDFLLQWLNLEGFRRMPARHLSGGYRRLLNLGCSLLHDPDIIFLDEPTVALDPNIRKTVWEKIMALKKQGKTICLTTHYLDEAEYLADRVSILFKGKILETDSPHNLIEKYGGKEIIRIHVLEINENVLAQLKKKVPHADVKLSEKTLTISFGRKTALKSLSAINAFLVKHKIEPQSSLIKEPDLEDVFIKLTGESPDE